MSGQVQVLASMSVAPLMEYGPHESVVFGIVMGALIAQQDPSLADSLLPYGIAILTGGTPGDENDADFRAQTKHTIKVLREAVK